MDGKTIGFIIWSIGGAAFIGMSIYACFAKKSVNIWANVKGFEVSDIRKYNRAVAKLFCVFGIVFFVLGLPLLAKQNSAWILLSVVGVMFESIIALTVYTLVIEKKYKKV